MFNIKELSEIRALCKENCEDIDYQIIEKIDKILEELYEKTVNDQIDGKITYFFMLSVLEEIEEIKQ